VTRNAIAIGGQSGWHTHPGPSLITVTVGAIVAYDSDTCAPRQYGTGDTFVDPGDGHVHLLRNESGASSHEAYKARQNERVRMRLFREKDDPLSPD